METPQESIEKRAVELSAEAFEAFCDDMSGMFGTDMRSVQQEPAIETAKDLKKRFKKLVAVNSVKAEGALDGVFKLVFDQGGLFTLSGLIVMMPERRILEEIKRGSIKDVEAMNDAVKEIGNLLVGSWDRVFREELEGHGHFVQSHTFIGKPWDEPQETIGLASGEECTIVPYEITVGSYPTFNCGVIFPKTIFDDTCKSGAASPDSGGQAETRQETEQETRQASEKREQEGSEVTADREIDDQADEEDRHRKSAEEDTCGEGTVDRAPEVRAEQDARETDTPPVLPEQYARTPLTICAKEIMEKDVVWGKEDDSVGQALTKLQQHNAGYMLIGEGGAPTGIVSKSDIAGAISPYLRPIFAKWRRLSDDATLQIRVKWIMTRPVRTITPNTSLATIVENMLHFSTRCFPVMDGHGKVQGMVTVFDILNVLSAGRSVSGAGKALQAPPLVGDLYIGGP